MFLNKVLKLLALIYFTCECYALDALKISDPVSVEKYDCFDYLSIKKDQLGFAKSERTESLKIENIADFRKELNSLIGEAPEELKVYVREHVSSFFVFSGEGLPPVVAVKKPSKDRLVAGINSKIFSLDREKLVKFWLFPYLPGDYKGLKVDFPTSLKIEALRTGLVFHTITSFRYLNDTKLNDPFNYSSYEIADYYKDFAIERFSKKGDVLFLLPLSANKSADYEETIKQFIEMISKEGYTGYTSSAESVENFILGTRLLSYVPFVSVRSMLSRWYDFLDSIIFYYLEVEEGVSMNVSHKDQNLSLTCWDNLRCSRQKDWLSAMRNNMLVIKGVDDSNTKHCK